MGLGLGLGLTSAAGSHCSLSAAWIAAARTMEGLQRSRCSVRRRVPGVAAAPLIAASVGDAAKLPPQTTLPGVTGLGLGLGLGSGLGLELEVRVSRG